MKKELKQVNSVRIKPSDKKLIVKHFGGLGSAVEHLVSLLKRREGKSSRKQPIKRSPNGKF